MSQHSMFPFGLSRNDQTDLDAETCIQHLWAIIPFTVLYAVN